MFQTQNYTMASNYYCPQNLNLSLLRLADENGPETNSSVHFWGWKLWTAWVGRACSGTAQLEYVATTMRHTLEGLDESSFNWAEMANQTQAYLQHTGEYLHFGVGLNLLRSLLTLISINLCVSMNRWVETARAHWRHSVDIPRMTPGEPDYIV